MEEDTLQETANRVKNFKGKVKGEAFRTRVNYIRYKEGEERVKKLGEKMKKLGVPLTLKR